MNNQLQKRILFYRYGNLCEPDVINAMKALNFQVECITEEIYDKGISPARCVELVSQQLMGQDYEFVFTINYYPAISEICHVFHKLYISWVVTCPVFELYSHAVRRSCNRIFMFDYAMYQEFAPQNTECIFYLPMGTAVEHMGQVCSEIRESDRELFSCDISFIGSLYSEKCMYNNLGNLPQGLKGFLDGLIEAQIDVYGYNFLERCITEEKALAFKQCTPGFYQFPELAVQNNRAVLAHGYLGTKVSEQERIRLLNALAQRFSVDLYTGSDVSLLHGVRMRGLAKTADEMPKIFALSKINLNITAKSIQTGIPLRVWDVLACGGFLLTNYQQELEEYFIIGKDLDCFSSQEELLEKAAYYLQHPRERQEIALHGQNTVRNGHGYLERVKEMLRICGISISAASE